MQFASLCVIRGSGKQIASFSWNDNSPHFPTKAESQANARLIAAAPEMADLLQQSWRALNSILAFYEPGQTHLDTEAWKRAEASGRRAHKDLAELLAKIGGEA